MIRKVLETGIPLARIAALVGGKLSGDAAAPVFGICPLDDPKPGYLAFSREVSIKRIRQDLPNLPIAGLIGPAELEIKSSGGNFVLVPDPLRAIMKLLPLFFEERKVAPGINPKADISPSAKLGERVHIGAFAVIGDDVQLGDDVVIHPHVVVYPGVKIGARSVLHSGAVIREDCEIGADNIIQNGTVVGADGFGYVPDPELGLRLVPQVGNVVLADRVEIGANTCVDRATLGTTSIGLGTKLDNHVQIGHNARIGSHSILCGMVAIAGSAKVGDRVTLAGYVGVGDHVSITNDVRVGAKGGVSCNIREKGDWGGYPPVKAHRWRMQCAALEQLPEMMRDVKRLRKLLPETEGTQE